MRKPAFCICENKDANQLRGSFAVAAKLISASVFAIRIVLSPFFLKTKFQASSHLVWLYSPVCVGPGRKPRRPVFSQRGSFLKCKLELKNEKKEISKLQRDEDELYSIYLFLSTSLFN